MKVPCPECGEIVKLIRGNEIPVHYAPSDGDIEEFEAYNICDLSGQEYDLDEDEEEIVRDEVSELNFDE